MSNRSSQVLRTHRMASWAAGVCAGVCLIVGIVGGTKGNFVVIALGFLMALYFIWLAWRSIKRVREVTTKSFQERFSDTPPDSPAP
jgi:predicted branched-subunit amino acid permease